MSSESFTVLKNNLVTENLHTVAFVLLSCFTTWRCFLLTGHSVSHLYSSRTQKEWLKKNMSHLTEMLQSDSWFKHNITMFIHKTREV